MYADRCMGVCMQVLIMELNASNHISDMCSDKVSVVAEVFRIVGISRTD